MERDEHEQTKQELTNVLTRYERLVVKCEQQRVDLDSMRQFVCVLCVVVSMSMRA